MTSSKKNYIYIGLGVSVALTAVVVFLITNASKTKIDTSPFDSPDMPGSGKCMNKDFLKMLVKLQKKTKLPIFKWINSGARSESWNKKVGGVANSAHKIPTCRAADIRTPTIAIRNKIVTAAKQVGFKRIGIARTFVHLDNDSSKKQYVAWGYPSGTEPPIKPFG